MAWYTSESFVAIQLAVAFLLLCPMCCWCFVVRRDPNMIRDPPLQTEHVLSTSAVETLPIYPLPNSSYGTSAGSIDPLPASSKAFYPGEPVSERLGVYGGHSPNNNGAAATATASAATSTPISRATQRPSNDSIPPYSPF
ncbi:hypothetical protein BDR26DRAFT_860409 [Obelidium mucronatum]|nr:hypothetical protein BDR26DRAFT_860409 [Obelidium mucronatum]